MGHGISCMQRLTWSLMDILKTLHLIIAQLISVTHLDVKVSEGSQHWIHVVGAGISFLVLYL